MKIINCPISFVIISCVLLSACSKNIDWQEEALLGSGQKIIIDRSVKLIPSELGHRRPSIYKINTKNPISGKKLNWIGSHGLNPIMLDFKNNKVFLVAVSGMCDAKIKQFSVKGFPYIFMESIDGKTWETINPNQVPTEFKNANLSFDYDSYYVRGDNFFGIGKFQSSEQILKANESSESHGGYFQISIPHNKMEWNYKLKNIWHEGCG